MRRIIVLVRCTETRISSCNQNYADRGKKVGFSVNTREFNFGKNIIENDLKSTIQNFLWSISYTPFKVMKS